MRLTLDQLEAERGEVEPFELDLGDGAIVSLPYPKDMPFETLIGLDADRPATVLRALMGEGAFDEFAGNPRVTLGVLEKVMTAYYQHYGLGSLGEGEGSRPSSIGSATGSKRASRSKATA